MDIVEFKNTVWDELRGITEDMDAVFCPIMEEHRLTMIQGRILLELHRTSGHTVGSLGKSMSMAGANISAMCKRLEHEGFLKRKRDEQDERVVRLVLLPKGEQTLNEIGQTVRERYAQLLEQEDPQELEGILESLQKLRMVLKKLHADLEGPKAQV